MTTYAADVNAVAQAAGTLRAIAETYHNPQSPDALILRAAAHIVVERARELRHD